MRAPLHRQIMLPFMAVAAASLLAVGGMGAYLAGRRIEARIERQIDGVTSVLASSNFPLTDRVLRQMQELSGAELLVTDDAGVVQAGSVEERPAVSSLPVDSGRKSPLGSRLVTGGETYFHRVTELPARGDDEPARYLHVLFPEAEFQSAWRAAFIPPIVVGAFALLGTAAVTHVMVGRLTRGAARVGAELLRIAEGDFTAAPLPARDDEIRDLSQAVNRTAEMLADYDRHVRASERMRTLGVLGAGLAHEMRNAATGCRMALDLHLEQCGPADENAQVAKRQLQLMETQLQRFLRAGRPTPGAERLVNLAALVEELWPLVRPAARHAGVELQWNRGAEEPLVAGDAEALGQAILNLVLNAIEAVQTSDAQPRVVGASLRADDREFASIDIFDNGPGPAEDVAPGIFQPFITSKPEGIGIGLAVAKSVVEAHRGTIDWVRQAGFTRFQIALPLAAKDARYV